MEQARYWMWTKQKHGLNFHVQAPSSTTNTKAAGYGDSWEEQAFAEDAAGALGGCIWPPRSYTCTFCRREFRSAQALGGHMNVHRRDRARLKQSSNPHNETIHLTNPSTTAATTTPLGVVHDLHYPPHQICAFLDHKPNHHVHVLAPPSSASRVLAPPIIQEKSSSCRGDQMALGSPNFSCPVVQEHKKRITISSSLSSPPSRSNVAADRHFHLSDPPKHEGDNISTKLDSGYRAKRDYVKADLSVSLNLVVCRARPGMSGSKEEEEEEEEGTVNCKRQRTNLAAPFFLKPSSVVDRHGPPRSEVLQRSPSSIEELDLELRLGVDPPKVK